MLYEALKDWKVYTGQKDITFPRGSGSDNKVGFGNAVFLLSPNIDKSIELINSNEVKFKKSYYKHYIIDSLYKEKIGKKNIVKNETTVLNKKFKTIDMPLIYVPRSGRKTIVNAKRNVVIDLSRWLELYFQYSIKTSAKIQCTNFLRFLNTKLNDPTFNSYNKLILIDIGTWVSHASDCVIMNKKFLNNPISLILYSAYHYPDLIPQYLKGYKFLIINHSEGQLLKLDSKEFTKKQYPKIKQKLKLFKDVVFSVEEEDSEEEITPEEVNAVVIDEFKSEVISNLKKQLVGNGEDIPDPFNDEYIEDVTEDLEEDDDEDIIDELPVEEDDSSEEKIDPEIVKRLDTLINEDPSIIDKGDTVSIAKKLADEAKTKSYANSFMPERNEKQEAKIKELLAIQNTVIKPNTDEDLAKSKIIDESDFSTFITSSSPNVLTSKFVNFDKNYNEKKMTQDIDNSVAMLSNASDKIFVVGKEEIDSSDTMNIKKTMVYTLKDEKGNRMTLKFDVPIIIDNNYIFLNGSKKIIEHQFILKPLVKTAPDTVQLVTAYNKVFIKRAGRVDQNTNNIKVYMNKNPGAFKIVPGNTSMKNVNYDIGLDFQMYCKEFYQFSVGDYIFITEIDKLIEKVKQINPNAKIPKFDGKFPVGYNKKTKELVVLKTTDSFSDFLLSVMPEGIISEIRSIKRSPKLMYAEATIMGKKFPLIVFMLYCEGFASVMNKANISYRVIDKKEWRKLDKLKYDSLELSDGILCWEKSPMRTALIMNGLKKSDLSIYTSEELENKDTYRTLLAEYYGDDSRSYAFDQYRDFMIDDVSKEILMDMNYPTDLVSLLILAVSMLCDVSFLPENNMENARIRSNEVISNIVYKQVTDAYNKYRRTAYKKKPSQVTIKQSAIIDTLLSEKTNMVEEFSTLNPVLEIEKARVVTFKGMRGINKDRAMTLPKRGYDESMLGVVGISTPPDANCGINRQMTLEPSITSTRGYVNVKNKKNVEDLNSANLLTPSEMLTPLGVIHDDPDRTAMSTKQTKYMVSIKDGSPVLIGNRVESVLPYLLSDEYIVDAKEDGQVVEVTKDFVIVKYKNGKNYAINIATEVKKNSQAGFFVEKTLKCDLKVGDKFKKGDILAYDERAFSMNKHGKGASMNLGALCKVAIAPCWDGYEDSAPVTKELSERLSTVMINEVVKTFEPNTYVEKIVKIGDQIKTGEPLMIFTQADDAEFAQILANVRDEYKEELVESTRSTITSKYTGEIVDIKVYSTVDTEDMDDSLAKLVTAYQNRIKKKNKVLDKYANPDDCNFYKAGQIINESDSKMTPGKTGKIKGEYATNKVIIAFYIKYKDVAAKGDKICAQFALKGVISHVIEEGREPYSEYRPEEEISTMIPPLSVSARKVPSIFLTMFGNKLLIELKRQLKDKWNSN